MKKEKYVNYKQITIANIEKINNFAKSINFIA